MASLQTLPGEQILQLGRFPSVHDLSTCEGTTSKVTPEIPDNSVGFLSDASTCPSPSNVSSNRHSQDANVTSLGNSAASREVRDTISAALALVGGINYPTNGFPGTYGAHPSQFSTRSSIDILLDSESTSGTSTSRHSLDELLAVKGNAMFPKRSVSALLQQLSVDDRPPKKGERVSARLQNSVSASGLQESLIPTVTVVASPTIAVAIPSPAKASSLVDAHGHGHGLGPPKHNSPSSATGGGGQLLTDDAALNPDLHDTFGAHIGDETGAFDLKSGTLFPSPCKKKPSQSDSVTFKGGGCGTTVPPLHVLRARKNTRAALLAADYTNQDLICGSTGYISEAKRVLGQAMQFVPALEAAVCDTSSSGAIGPLLRYLKENAANDDVVQPTLHTLSLLVANSPNRDVVLSFQGLEALLSVLRLSNDLTIKEDVVQLLWDLDSKQKKAPFKADDIKPLLSVMEWTSAATTASHALHFLEDCLCKAEDACAETLSCAAKSLVAEAVAHKHHLQDAAQYALGGILAKLLGDRRVSLETVHDLVKKLLSELQRCGKNAAQGQILLTILSCLAGNGRVRASLAELNARRIVAGFGQKSTTDNIRTRALSLLKVLQREEVMSGWYFGADV